MSGYNNSSGVTLVELLTALAIMAVTTALIIPGIQTIYHQVVLNQELTKLKTALILAKTEARADNKITVICPIANTATPRRCSNSNNWSNGWLVRSEEPQPHIYELFYAHRSAAIYSNRTTALRIGRHGLLMGVNNQTLVLRVGNIAPKCFIVSKMAKYRIASAQDPVCAAALATAI